MTSLQLDESRSPLRVGEWAFVVFFGALFASLALIILYRGEPIADPLASDQLLFPATEQIDVVGAIGRPGLYSWPKQLSLQQFIEAKLELEEHAEPERAFLLRKGRGSAPQLRIPSSICDYVYCKGALLREGWYSIPKGTSWRELPSHLPLSDQVDGKRLRRYRRKLRPWEQLTIPEL